MKRLIIGDPESIEYKDDFEKQIILKKLRKTVRCPFCGAMNIGEFEFDKENECIGWNFDCKTECPNSFEYAEANSYENAELYTNFNGKFIY